MISVCCLAPLAGSFPSSKPNDVPLGAMLPLYRGPDEACSETSALAAEPGYAEPGVWRSDPECREGAAEKARPARRAAALGDVGRVPSNAKPAGGRGRRGSGPGGVGGCRRQTGRVLSMGRRYGVDVWKVVNIRVNILVYVHEQQQGTRMLLKP